MIVTEKRIAANRANAARSTGPKTPEGKARSSHNATKHGMLSSIVTLRNEDPAAFDDTVQTYIDRIKPQDDIELSLCYQLAAATWRIRRSLAIEAHMMDVAMENRATAPSELDRTTSAFGDLAPTHEMRMLHRNQHRLTNLHSRLARDVAFFRREFPLDPTPTSTAEKNSPNEATNPLLINKTPLTIEPTQPTDHPADASL